MSILKLHWVLLLFSFSVMFCIHTKHHIIVCWLWMELVFEKKFKFHFMFLGGKVFTGVIVYTGEPVRRKVGLNHQKKCGEKQKTLC